MKISILTLFPEMFEGFVNTSIIKRAIDQGIVEVEMINFRNYTLDKHKHVDDTPYGGGAGMLLKLQPLVDCLKNIKTENSHIVLLTPTGKVYNQSLAKEYTQYNHLILICGHYEGFDERILYYIDEEVSIGDYVLTGGELASQIISDSVIRLLDGTIKSDSYEDDSFQTGLLEYPQYTKPEVYDDHKVPDVLLSGHHENIRKWRLYKSLEKTYKVRPDLLEKADLTDEMKEMLKDVKKN